VARLGGLGKGLGSLIPPSEMSEGEQSDQPRLESVPIDSITPNPHQPRVHFDEESLADLAASIQEIGVLQPILVRPVEAGFEIIAGERRWRAAKRAGLQVIPAIVRMTDDAGSMERALIENLHRQDLTPLEEAAAYQQLVEDFSLTHEQVATRVGKSRSAVTNTLRLMTLPPSLQHLLADGRLSAGHAKALLGTPDRAFQEQLGRRAADEGWTVRAVEEAVRARQSGSTEPEQATADSGSAGRSIPGSSSGTRLRPPGLLELEELLAECLSTRVAVTMGSKQGKIVIDFADLEDLERLYHQISGRGPEGETTESD